MTTVSNPVVVALLRSVVVGEAGAEDGAVAAVSDLIGFEFGVEVGFGAGAGVITGA